MEPISSESIPDTTDRAFLDVPGAPPVTSRTNASQPRSVALSPYASSSREVDRNATIERFAERARQQFEDLLWSLEPSELRDIASAIEQNGHHRLSRKRQRRSESNVETSTRLRSASDDVAIPGPSCGNEGSEAAICVRCFRNWAKAIDGNKDIVECVTEKPKRKKCESCSLKRVSCEYIPYDGAKTLRRLKVQMDQASAADWPAARRKFEREYWRLSDYIYDHPIPAETDRKAKQRAHKRLQRRAILHAENAENAENQVGNSDIREGDISDISTDSDGEEDDLAVEAQIREETQRTL
ncbi:hypothetical protein N7457_003135 [Penicillium paradoxum]|uniref:uncharacterized protein n=1 Tax=Penicillium paradoxum TaxID=176176 RepID=UPI002547807A|nr:uncharacterized protein N7457_003135 [Penicillium paradoxum]KAJ5788145.1 hypothetical protein N7457_003135 [Penicillium paradoxum]